MTDYDYHAYDYPNQRWVHGAEALNTLISQASEDLALLESDKGAEYAQAIGVDRETEIKAARDTLRVLKDRHPELSA